MAEIKRATTYEEQLEILEQRGIVVSDEEACKKILENINYYRLLAYLLPFKIDDQHYKEGTEFLRVYRIYEFDRKLRRILFSALEDVEISLRAKFSYYHAHKYGPIGYLDPSNFSDKHDPVKFKDQIDREVYNNRSVPFVKHHIDNYGGVFPLWAMTELFTFGMLSRFYADMTTADQKYLARRVYNSTPSNIRSWLRCCSDLRNICAHYGRLYFRVFSAIPAGFSLPQAVSSRLWGAVLALRGLYMDPHKWNAEVVPAISALIEEYRDAIDLHHLAFPPDWEAQLAK